MSTILSEFVLILEMFCYNKLIRIASQVNPLSEVIGMNDFEAMSLEQQFRQRSFETLVERMSHEQAQEFLVKIHKQMLLQEATYRNLLRSSLMA